MIYTNWFPFSFELSTIYQIVLILWILRSLNKPISSLENAYSKDAPHLLHTNALPFQIPSAFSSVHT